MFAFSQNMYKITDIDNVVNCLLAGIFVREMNTKYFTEETIYFTPFAVFFTH